MKRALIIMGVTFGVTLAIIFAARASADALGIVIGVVLGILARVPTTLLLVWLLARSRNGLDRYGPALPPQPPVVVVTPQSLPQPPYLQPPSLSGLAPPVSRRAFTIVGDEETGSE